MKEKQNESTKTNASLYNGQPADTGQSCHGVGLTSCTPPIFGDKSGVSVENAPMPSLHWFVLRVSYGRALKAKEILDTLGFECYVPMRYKQVKRQGKSKIVTEPLLPSFLFVHASAENIETVLHDNRVNTLDGRSLLTYYYDHTSYRQDCPDRNPPLIISDGAMHNFIRLTSIRNPHIIPITSSNIQFKMGDKVVVIDGEFKGIHGRVARIAGQQRVIVELFDGCLVASAYIPKEAMEKC